MSRGTVLYTFFPLKIPLLRCVHVLCAFGSMAYQNNFGPDLRVVACIGGGSFADVLKVRHNTTKQYFAAKRFKKRYRTHEEINRLPEIVALRRLSGHPNISTLYDVMYEPSSGTAALILDLMDLNLFEFIKENKQPVSEDVALLLIYQLLRALEFVHSKQMFHRDVKPENCLVRTSTLELKLCDFGSTRIVDSTTPYTEYVVTRWYRAPECILTKGSYGKEVDIWAVGCILFELLAGKPLFPGTSEIDQIKRIHQVLGTPSMQVLSQFRSNPNTEISFSFSQSSPQDLHRFLRQTSDLTIELIKQMLIYDPRDRISAMDALRHPALAKLRNLEIRWQTSGCPGSFAVFCQNPTDVPRPVESKGAQKPEHPSRLRKAPIAPPKVVSRPKISFDDSISLVESRKKAAQRILEYRLRKQVPKQTFNLDHTRLIHAQHSQQSIKFDSSLKSMTGQSYFPPLDP